MSEDYGVRLVRVGWVGSGWLFALGWFGLVVRVRLVRVGSGWLFALGWFGLVVRVGLVRVVCLVRVGCSRWVGSG